MNWKPDTAEALKALIRQTIDEAGEISPAELPHHVRRQLEGHASGEADLDRLIRDALAERSDKRR